MSIALPFDDLLGGLGGLAALSSLTSLGGGEGGGLPGLGLLSGLTGGGAGGLPGLDLLSGLTGGASGLPGLDLLSGLTSALPGLGGQTTETSAIGGLPLPGLDALGGGLPGLDALGGGLPGLDALGGGGLPGLDLLSGGLGGLGGAAGGEGGNGSVYGTSNGPVGGLLFTLESSTFGVPVLGEFVGGVVRSQVEGGGVQNIVMTQLLGTPLFEPVQSLIGGNSYGDELVLYEPATAPVALTEGLPVVNEVTRMVVTGSFPTSSAFIGSYLGGLASEDLLQNFVSTGGMVGTGADAVEAVIANLPMGNMLFDGNDINSTLDLITNSTDQILYVDDLVAGALGGDALNSELPFNNALGGALEVFDSAGLAGPFGALLYEGLTPIATNLQEVQIAGPIVLGTLGKLM